MARVTVQRVLGTGGLQEGLHNSHTCNHSSHLPVSKEDDFYGASGVQS